MSFEKSVDNNMNHFLCYSDNDYRFSENRNDYYRPKVSYRHSSFARNSSQSNQNFSNISQWRVINNNIKTSRKPFPISQTNTRHNNNSQKSAVNAIDLSSSSANVEPLQEAHTIGANDQG